MEKDIRKDKIQLEGVGLVDAKHASEFKSGDIIQQAHGYTLRIQRIDSETDTDSEITGR